MLNLSNEIERVQSALKIISQDLATAKKHAKKGDFENAEIWLNMAYSCLSIIVQANEIAQMKAKYGEGSDDE
ncbi:hypothetical protein B0186_04495 [Canicola haemoglobinophilus]|uniref:Uncharacterized protein n=1 Tax=Canicola haemoglobinophilus TaxID=733 RepID=A0A1V4B1W1_9PAST|nr:hypothetical protein [Canicola haemoglobinophilus]OOS01191.1 hypothetical protein B0186_04495 [Canicola haemoglobinophilus]STO61042.1 Uncharacterised protein [Canicola haemoglobinophilus]